MDLFWEKAESIFKSKRKPNPITDGGAWSG
jgi:hypothetical protein